MTRFLGNEGLVPRAHQLEEATATKQQIGMSQSQNMIQREGCQIVFHHKNWYSELT